MQIMGDSLQLWKVNFNRSRSRILILIISLVMGMLAISYIQNEGAGAFLETDSRNLESVVFNQSSTYVRVDLADRSGQPTRGSLQFSGSFRNLKFNGSELTLFTLVGSDQQRNIVELPVVLDRDRKLSIGGVAGSGMPIGVPLPLGISKFKLSINSDNVLRIIVDDSTVIASASLIPGLGMAGFSALVLEPSVPHSRVDGLFSVSGTYNYSKKSVGTGLISSVLWLLFIAVVISVFVFVQMAFKKSTSQIAQPNVRFFLATAAVVSSVITLTGIVVMLLKGPSPFLEPNLVSMGDWLDSLAAAGADPYLFAQSAYQPLSYALLQLVPFDYGSVFFLILSAISIGILGGSVGTLSRFTNSWHGYIPGISLSASFSVWFALDRGNIDLIISALTAGIFGWSLTARITLPVIAAGIVSSLKWFSLPVSILGLKDKNSNNVRMLLTLLLFFISANLVAVFAGPFHNQNPLSLFSTGSTLIDLPLESRLNYSISLWSWIYLVMENFLGISNQGLNELFGSWLIASAIPALSLSSLFIVLWWGKTDRWRSASIMAIGVCILLPVSYSYKAILLIACLSLISKISQRICSPAFTGVLFALFISAPTFLSFQGVTLATWISAPIGIALVLTLMKTKERRMHRDSIA